MIFIKEHYRDFNARNRFIFENVERADNATELWKKPVEELDLSGMNVERAIGAMESAYGHSAYKSAIRTYVNGLFKNAANPAIAKMEKDLIENSAGNYKTAFEGEILPVFADAIRRLNGKHERAIDLIIEHTEEELNTLNDQIDAMQDALKSEPKMDIPSPDEVGTEDVNFMGMNIMIERKGVDYEKARGKVKYTFEKWGNKMLDAYMTEDLKDSDLGDALKEGLNAKFRGKIDFLFEEGKASKETIEALKTEFLKRLSEYAKIDGKTGTISRVDAEVMWRAAAEVLKREQSMIDLISKGSDSAVKKALETRAEMDPEAWIKAVTMTGEAMIENAIESGNEQGFVNAITTLAKKPAGSFDFDEASNLFLNQLTLRASTGAKNAIDFLEHSNRELNRGNPILERIEPRAFSTLVFSERNMLLERTTIPKSEYDKAVVEFMSTNREGRDEMLEDPKKRRVLFEAIKVIKEDYEIALEEYGDVPERITSNFGHPNKKLTQYDKMARLRALIMIAKETEWIVKNLSKAPEYQKAYQKKAEGESKSMEEELKKTTVKRRTEEGGLYVPNLDFENIHTVYKTGYVSIAARNGFNGKDLALSTAKGIAGFTVAINIMNAIKNKGGLLSNPYIFSGAAIFYGIKKYQENPEVGDYFSATPGKRANLETNMRLRSLAKKTGRRRLKNFIAKESEWKAMEDLDADEIKTLIGESTERYAPHPVITKADLKPFIAKEAWVHLPEEGFERERFMFYTKFLAGNKNIHILKEECQKWQ